MRRDVGVNPNPAGQDPECPPIEDIVPAHRSPVKLAGAIQRLGDKVRHLRQRAGLSQTELAHQLGMQSRGYISAIELGDKLPTLDRALAIARLFHVSMDYLVRDELDEPEHKAHT